MKYTQIQCITGYNSFEIIGVLPDNYVIKSLKIDKHVVVELFEKFDNHLLIDKYDRTSYNLQLYENDVPQLFYNFKYKTFRHKYIKITYRYALGLNNLYNIFPSNLLTSWNYNSKTNEEKTETKRTDEIPFEYSVDDVKTASNIYPQNIVSYNNGTEIDHSTTLNPKNSISYDYSTDIDQSKNLLSYNNSNEIDQSKQILMITVLAQ